MESLRLRYFLVVNETGSIRKAADLLNLSPAALSKAMKQLEEELGFKLLVPSGRGILISDEGKDLALQAKPLLSQLSGLADRVRRLRDDSENPPIKIGSFEVFTTHFLGELLQFLPDQSELLLREVIPGEMEKTLLSREIDFGITYIPIPTSGVEHQQISTISMGVYGTKEFFQKYRDHTFERFPFVIPIQPISGSPNKVQGLDGWPDDRIVRSVKYRVSLMESALEICRKGLAVAYLPEFVVRLHNETAKPRFQLEQCPPPRGLGSVKQSVFLARRKSDSEGEIHKKLARAVRMISK